ncbi:hypothetical protein [Mycoplasma zalophidermidis]|uniref:hypothetical protein n=1 Tax=Mycoplasma zalophidermidis TaxID=398174 RepID=UPI00215D405E|nr:hypothetical protein [Mycoplasma zalophidermidis]MCR8966441.1 hypothetical protein [Mycoplasma zalophidermidis]
MKIINFFDRYKSWKELINFNDEISEFLESIKIETLNELTGLDLNMYVGKLNEKDYCNLTNEIKKIRKTFVVNLDFENLTFFNLDGINSSFYSYPVQYFEFKNYNHSILLEETCIDNLFELTQFIYLNLQERKKVNKFINVLADQLFYTRSNLIDICKILNFYENLYKNCNYTNHVVKYNYELINFLLSKLNITEVQINSESINLNVKAFVIEDFNFKTILNESDYEYINTLILEDPVKSNEFCENKNEERSKNNVTCAYTEWEQCLDLSYLEIFKPISNFIDLNIRKRKILESYGYYNLHDLMTKKDVKSLIEPTEEFPELWLNKLNRLKKVWIAKVIYPLDNLRYFKTSDLDVPQEVLDYPKEYFNLSDNSELLRSADIIKAKSLSELYEFVKLNNLTPVKQSRAVKLWKNQKFYIPGIIELRHKKIKSYIRWWNEMLNYHVMFNESLIKFISNKDSFLNINEDEILDIYYEFVISFLKDQKLPVHVHEITKMLLKLNDINTEKFIKKLRLSNNLSFWDNFIYYEHIGINQIALVQQTLNENKIISHVTDTGINVSEYIYSYLYENYDITLQIISKYFILNELQSMFIRNTSNKGNVKFVKAFYDPLIPPKIKVKFSEILINEYKITMIDNNFLKVDNSSLVIYVLKSFGTKLVSNEVLFEKLIKFINDNNFNDFISNSLVADYRLLERILVDSTHALISYGKESRYYDIEKYSIEEWMDFIDELKLENYNDKLISTKILFKENKALIYKYDLNNEYILHSLLRKLKERYNLLKNVSIKRMPYIEIGNADRNKQLAEYLKLDYPIKISEFFRKYSEEFGFKEASIRANNSEFISKYKYKNDYLSIENNFNPTIEEIKSAKKIIDKNIYKVEEFTKLINNILNTNISDLTLDITEKINYTIAGEYVYKKDLSSFYNAFYETYFKDKRVVKDTDISIVNCKNTNIFNYDKNISNALYKLLYEYKIFFIDKHRNSFTTLDTLSLNSGITVNDIFDYIKKCLYYSNNTYFTFKSLLKNGLKHKLIELGFSSYFYESILKYHIDIWAIPVSQLIFIKKNNTSAPSFMDFINFVIDKHFWQNGHEYLYLSDLIDVFKDFYCYEIDYYKLKNKIKELNNYYFNEITEIIYKSKDVFLEKFKEK